MLIAFIDFKPFEGGCCCWYYLLVGDTFALPLAALGLSGHSCKNEEHTYIEMESIQKTSLAQHEDVW